MKNNTSVWILALILIGGGAFYGGMKYQQNQQSQRFTRNGQFFGQNTGPMGGSGTRGAGRFTAGGRGALGEVLSVDADSITVKMQDGSSKIVNLSSLTVYTKSEKAQQSDVVKGINVLAVGTTNSDGSITAQDIQINPIFAGASRQ